MMKPVNLAGFTFPSSGWALHHVLSSRLVPAKRVYILQRFFHRVRYKVADGLNLVEGCPENLKVCERRTIIYGGPLYEPPSMDRVDT